MALRRETSAETSSSDQEVRGRLKWEPYRPPQPRGSNWFTTLLLRYKFSIVVALAAIGIGALLYFAPRPRGYSPGYAMLSVYSDPGDARVIVNGDTVGSTPLQGYPVDEGAYTIAVAKTNYRTRDTVVTLRSGRRTILAPRLTPESASSVGSDAANEEPPGRVVSDQTGGRSLLESSGEDAGDADTVLPDRGETNGQEPGTLELTSNPDSTVVELDGETVGTTPMTLGSVAPNTYAVTFSRTGYQSVTREIDVAPGDTLVVSASLEASRGHLRVLVRPWGSVFIDGELRAQSSDVWYETDLRTGTYRVTAEHPSLGRTTRRVRLSPADTQSVVFDMREE